MGNFYICMNSLNDISYAEKHLVFVGKKLYSLK